MTANIEAQTTDIVSFIKGAKATGKMFEWLGKIGVGAGVLFAVFKFLTAKSLSALTGAM